MSAPADAAAGAGAAATSAAAAPPAAAREPRQERSRLTRQRLLEAAIESLAEHGWSGATVAVVAERAGVSRGAAQHHFRTREELVTAAVRQVAAVRADEIRRRAEGLQPGQRRTEEVLDLLAEHFTSPVFTAALQLWVAASTDPQLHAVVAPLEAVVGRETHRFTVDVLGADETHPGVREAVQATLDLMRGLGLANLLSDDSARRRRLLRQWAAYLDTALRPSGSAC
ncbi:MAG: TetR family transcriptional regulator [Micromonosporaceae bacterium]|nr:TetR family transcriptional regulator [Micromonosporaceae bacterium]